MNFKAWLIMNEVSDVKVGENIHIPANLRPLSIKVKYDWMVNKFKDNPNPKLKFDVNIKNEKTFEFYYPGKLVYIEFEEKDSGKPFYSKMGVLGIDEKGNTMYWYDAYSEWIHGKPIKLQIEIPLYGEQVDEKLNDAYQQGFEGTTVQSFQNYGQPKSDREMEAFRKGQYDAVHFYPYGASMPSAKKPEKKQSTYFGWGGGINTHGWGRLASQVIEKLVHEVINELPTTPTLKRYLKYKNTIKELIDVTLSYVKQVVIDQDKKMGINDVKKYIAEIIPGVIANAHEQEKMSLQNIQNRLAHYRSYKGSETPEHRGWGNYGSEEGDRLRAIEQLEKNERGSQKRLAVHQKIEAEKALPRQQRLPIPFDPRRYDFVKELNL